MRKSILACFACLVLLPTVSAGRIENPSVLALEHIIPFGIASLTALILWKWMIPSQLSSLQVGFEVDDGIYEVHRLTKGRKDALALLKLKTVGFGVALYMMAMIGVLLLISELIFSPNVFYLPNVILMGVLVLVPILISPWVSLNGQLFGSNVSSGKPKFMRVLVRRAGTMAALVFGSLASYVFLVPRIDESQKPLALAVALLVFMGPTILAYGRIMGASWNMLMISKFRSWLGRPNPIDPDKLGFVGRSFSFILIVFLITMPFTAINGIVTVVHVMLNKPDNAHEILNYGGILGHQVYLFIRDNPLLAQWEALKSLPEVLAAYLSINIAIVGLAFIFELTRNLFLGGQAFGGLGGVILATPREIRAEEKAQARVLYFAFAGFSGYTALLLILVCYKEFGSIMPFTDWFESKGFDETNRLLVTWIFIAVGQTIFLLTWVLSVARFNQLRKIKFDLNPDERREGAIMAGGGNWMMGLIEDAATRDDLDALIRFQSRTINEDEAIVRLAKSRAKMIEMALRGLWPAAIEEAKKVLAQAGGDDDEARLLIAAGHIACRRLDAARESLHNLQQPEGYDEPELMAFVCEWFDPWHGSVSDDDLWDWENNSCIDHLNDLMKMLRDWSPQPKDSGLHKDKLTTNARISHVGLLRAQNLHDEALEIALRLVREEPLMVKPRIAAALCLLDAGLWHSAMSVLSELEESDSNDPRVKALAMILGRKRGDGGIDNLEVALTLPANKKSRRWIDDAPVNPIAALMAKGGVDEALNANFLIAAADSVEHKMTPRFGYGILSTVITWGILTPLWLFLGIAATTELGVLEGIAIGFGLVFLHQASRRFKKQQRRIIKHRDQKAMVAFAKRLKRNKIKLTRESLPIGSHLLLSGMLLTVNGIVYDVGLPGWLTIRLNGTGERSIKAKLARRATAMRRSKNARMVSLSSGWWLKRPKEEGAEIPAMERLVGPVAYRGRTQMIQRKTGTISKQSGASPKRGIMHSNLTKRGIPHNTIRSERSKPTSQRPRRRKPGDDFGVY
jgi:hypothetical protein